jgi:hypothetical protein
MSIKEDQNVLVGTERKSQRSIPTFVNVLKQKQEEHFEWLFADGPILVPMPRSSLSRPGSLVPALSICQEMVNAGIGSEVRQLLTRVKAIQKAAFAKPEDRPTIQNRIDSIEI